MVCVPPLPVENLGKVCENSRAGENPRLRLWCSFFFLITVKTVSKLKSLYTIRLVYKSFVTVFQFAVGNL